MYICCFFFGLHAHRTLPRLARTEMSSMNAWIKLIIVGLMIVDSILLGHFLPSATSSSLPQPSTPTFDNFNSLAKSLLYRRISKADQVEHDDKPDNTIDETNSASLLLSRDLLIDNVVENPLLRSLLNRYRQVHSTILSSMNNKPVSLSSRFVVLDFDPLAGLGNRLQVLISTFLFALLSDRGTF
jgi:hypothetical protein